MNEPYMQGLFCIDTCNFIKGRISRCMMSREWIVKRKMLRVRGNVYGLLGQQNGTKPKTLKP